MRLVIRLADLFWHGLIVLGSIFIIHDQHILGIRQGHKICRLLWRLICLLFRVWNEVTYPLTGLVHFASSKTSLRLERWSRSHTSLV